PQGRVRLLGTSSGVGARPALEVWLVEEIASGDGDGIEWVALDELLARAGSPGLRDARTLAALHVLARSGLATYAAADRAAAAASRLAGEEFDVGTPLQPLELLLERLHAADGTEEPSAKEVPPELLLNMELSRMSFDERILVMAEDTRTPLLERVLFLSMFGSRRDDFFMTRVARFKRELAAGESGRTIDGLTPAEQLDVIAIRARHVTERAYRLFRGRLLPDLQEHGIEVFRWRALSEADRAHVRHHHADALDALITPLAADPTHPFPHIRNLRPALAAIVRLPESRAEHFVAIELPGELPRFVPLTGGTRFVPLEDVIEAALPDLYPGLEVVRAHTFRVTRSAKLELDDDAVDMLRAIEHVVARRPFQEVVRLEVDRSMPPDMRRMLLRELQFEAEEAASTLGEQDVYAVDWMVDLAALKQLAALDIPELHWPRIERRSPFPDGRAVFDLISERDRMVQFPNDSFEHTVERFLSEAAGDPDVVSIKITLYRTARDSAVIDALRRARANGKDALALVELKASFDERRNIEWARGLEEDGIHIVYTPPQIKVHAKIALVVRREEGEHRRYAYIGTGNLNATTSASYVDVGILTARPTLVQELGDVFNLLTGYSADVDCERLLVAPFNMRRRFLRLIEREIEHRAAGRPAGIRAQLNGLADRRLIGALYGASQAGVPIELMVREICSLRPGVPGVSENIRAVSLLGRFLQHARIFEFQNGGQPEYFIGSADWRPRNLRERIEVITPVLDAEHCARLAAMLEETLNHPDAWQIRGDGSYVRGQQVVGGPTGGDSER
ncbi:MAG: polyphosphate kinase 1, partial [Longimicrobiales bacterium]